LNYLKDHYNKNIISCWIKPTG